MALDGIKIHLVLGRLFFTDQYKWHEGNGKCCANNGGRAKLRLVLIVIFSTTILRFLLPEKLDKRTYVAFNEILFTYFCFMGLILASYLVQEHHVQTYNALDEIDNVLAKMNIDLANKSTTIINHITIVLSYTFLGISGFINLYCANFCDARPSTVFKFALMTELLYKNSILPAVIRIMRDRFKGLNDIMKVAGKGCRNCALCQQRHSSEEDFCRNLQNYSVDEYCITHLLKFVRVIHNELTKCATSWNAAMNPYIIVLTLFGSCELYTQILYIFTLFTHKGAITKAGVDTLALSLFADICLFLSMFNLLQCCQNMVEEWGQTGRIIHRLFYSNKPDNAAVSEILSFSYQLKQKPFRFVYLTKSNLDWGAVVIIIRYVIQLAVIGLQFKFNEYFKV